MERQRCDVSNIRSSTLYYFSLVVHNMQHRVFVSLLASMHFTKPFIRTCYPLCLCVKVLVVTANFICSVSNQRTPTVTFRHVPSVYRKNYSFSSEHATSKICYGNLNRLLFLGVSLFFPYFGRFLPQIPASPAGKGSLAPNEFKVAGCRQNLTWQPASC